MATVCSPRSTGLNVMSTAVDMQNASVAADRFGAALSGLGMKDPGAVFALHVAFSVRAEKAKDSQIRTLYERVSELYRLRFEEIRHSRKADPVFMQDNGKLREKFLMIYPLGNA